MAADAARLRETVNINKSLSCLADVFSAIGGKQSHVPFRNSKLTTVLQDCLSGEGKAVMIVNVSPALASAPESLCSLRFASQVNRVELGRAARVCLAPAAPSSAPSIESAPAKVLDGPGAGRSRGLAVGALNAERSRAPKRLAHEDRDPPERSAAKRATSQTLLGAPHREVLPGGAFTFLAPSRAVDREPAASSYLPAAAPYDKRRLARESRAPLGWR